mmetsp:Transcript_75277/g.243708  ORF Transcript_75277/g.243708 Transcript_75277/m.243708 type:complete len:732 (-) Transcript_75277:154-2349(-)
MAKPTPSEVCEAIQRLVALGPSAALASDAKADAELLQERSKQLADFSVALAEAASKQKRAKPAGLAEASASVAGAKCARPASVGRWADNAAFQESWGSQLALGLCVVCLTLPYYICVTYTSWFVDEGFAIYRNPDAKGETPILEVLKHDFWGTSLNPPEGYNTHKSYRPLVTLSYAAEWLLCQRFGYGGREMQPMRLLSCVVHSLNASLVLQLILRLGVTRPWALLGAALFAAHPIHIENIVYLVGRADALATLFSLLVALIYLRRTLCRTPSLPWYMYLVLILLTATAGLCKEPGFTILFFLACAEVVLRSRWRHFFGLLLSFASVGAVRIWYVGGAEAGFGYVDTPIKYMDSRLTRTLSYLYQHAYYAKILVLPWHQSWDYSYDSLPMLHTFEDVRMMAIISAYLSIAALAALGLRLCARAPVLILGLGLTIIPFIPASNLFFLVGTTIGERLLYPCTVGWSLMVASVGSRSSRRSPLRGVIWGAFALLLCVYLWNSHVRMGHWTSTTKLFLTDAEHWSRSVKVVHSKASELQAKDDLHGALEYYLKSLAIFDDQAITDYCIARIYINLGRFDEARQRFDKILNGHGIGFHDGNDFLWMTDLGYLLVATGSVEGGIHYLKEGLQRFAYSCYGWNALGVAQLRMGQHEQAVQSFMQGLQCDPDSASIWSNIAVAFAQRQQVPELTEAMQKALALTPQRPAVAWNMRIFTGQGLPGETPQLDLYIPLPGRR